MMSQQDYDDGEADDFDLPPELEESESVTFNETDMGNVLDLLWWIRGWQAGGGTYLDQKHLTTLSKIRDFILDVKEKGVS